MSGETWHDHALSRTLVLPNRASDLARELRGALRKASDAGTLRTSPQDVNRLVRLLPEPTPNLAAQLRAGGMYDGAYCIIGGEKNLKRDRSLAHFRRDDDAWFDFTITVRAQAGQLELLAYDFEIRFPPGRGSPFLRIDLNLPAHRNDERELRSHLHPGSDDLQVPAPMMSPTEVLALFVDGFRLATNRDKPRDPTAFEVDWYRDTHAAHVALATR